MQKDYYQNILYPLQDKILGLFNSLPVSFYLTGGTALNRAYLHHRYSDDLDFFVNRSDHFKQHAEVCINAIQQIRLKYEIAQTEEDFARVFIHEHGTILKIDFVNDVAFRFGEPVTTETYRLTDTPLNILSNKITALSRLEPKDVVDIIFIALEYTFEWPEIIGHASEKDMWVTPVEAARILDEFPIQKLTEIKWTGNEPDQLWFSTQLRKLIIDLLEGNPNSLCK